MNEKKGLMQKIGEKIGDGGNKIMDAVTATKKESAQEQVKEHLEYAPESYQIKFRTYELDENFSDDIKKMQHTDKEEIDAELQKIENIAFKHQLYRMEDHYEAVFPVDMVGYDRETGKYCYDIHRISNEKQTRGLMLKKIVLNKDELQSDKLNNVYSSMTELGSTLALCIHRTPQECIMTFLIKSTAEADNRVISDNNLETFENVLLGNFPGTQTKKFEGGDSIPETYAAIPEINEECPERLRDMRGAMSEFKEGGDEYSVSDFLDEIFCPEQCGAISMVSGIPSLKSKDSRFMNQGIEKLIDGIVPNSEEENYTLLLLAEPLTPQDVVSMRNGYEQIASLITPFKGFQYNETVLEACSKNNSENATLSKQVNESTSYSLGIGAHANATAGASASMQNGISNTESYSEGTSHTEGHSKQKGESYSVSDSHKTIEKSEPKKENKKPIKGNPDNAWNRVCAAVSTVGHGGKKRTGYSESSNKSYSNTDSTTDTVNNTYGKSNGISHSDSVGASANASAGINANIGINETILSGRSYSTGINYGLAETFGKNTGITRNAESIQVKHVLERLEQEIKRLSSSESSGLWRFSGYVLARDRAMSQRVAHMYRGLIQGEDSSVERCTVNNWNAGNSNFNAIVTSLLNLEHPRFVLKNDCEHECLPESVYCATELNSAELSLAMSLPQKAVAGLPVVTCTAFGRNVCTVSGEKIEQNDSIRLGNLYHMLGEEKNHPVLLDKNKLSSHVFITGSTGSGKSNTIYKLLQEIVEPEFVAQENNEMMEEPVIAKGMQHFLVIEPTKGEYKYIFGGWENVNVYGTNRKVSALLRINPFAFPKEIHVLEHIDRLVEIFNACWPMYAAMPAILKDAIAQSYQQVGWDLEESFCESNRFPTFRILMDILPEVIAKSKYSSDTNSDYVGALVTRVNELTTGLNGTIFNSVCPISDEKLFDENTIIDLSRVGSSTTKALLMGILIMKLQEYRINCRIESPSANELLRHVTVLEEAHLLLRKTSMEQSQEGANLQGKAVEMLTNAIAEMRTYGEAFIIADQAPDLLETAVIRNTNTKIVLRLPDERDRTLVGGAMALNKQQIEEIAKLPNWVAAVYQSDWQESVLCKIDDFSHQWYRTLRWEDDANKEKSIFRELFECMIEPKSVELAPDRRNTIITSIKHLISLDDVTENAIEKCLRGEELSEKEKRWIAYDLLHGKSLYSEIVDSFVEERELMASKVLVAKINSEYDVRDLELTKKIVRLCYDETKTMINLDEAEKKQLEVHEKEFFEWEGALWHY